MYPKSFIIPEKGIIKNKAANIAKIALVIVFLIILYLPFVYKVYKHLLLSSIFAVGYILCVFLLLFYKQGMCYFVSPFCFSYVRKPPNPSIPIRTVIKLPISNSGMGGMSMPIIVTPNSISGDKIK